MADIPISFSAATSEREPDVQMTMVQESFGLDAKYNTSGASGVRIAKSDKLLEKPLAASCNSIPSSYVLKGKADVEGFDRPATEKRVDFMSSAALSSAFQPLQYPLDHLQFLKVPLVPTPTAAVLEGPRGSRTQKGVDMYKSFGSASSSGLSTSSVLFNLGDSTSPNQTNGFPVSAITTTSTTTSNTSSITAAESLCIQILLVILKVKK